MINQCEKCGAKTKIYKSKPVGTLRRRWYKCPKCGYRYRTYEKRPNEENVK